jgi:peroxiredoxin Q/BCP
MSILKEGQKAPEFTGKDQTGKLISLKDFKGKKIILFFYPKDNSPTCTTQACNLRDHYEYWLQKDYQIIGVSKDSPRSHNNFIKKFDLPFPIISDEDLAINKLFGVWGEKKMYGRMYMGTIRTTFVIDEKGRIIRVVDDLASAEHSVQLLEKLQLTSKRNKF